MYKNINSNRANNVCFRIWEIFGDFKIMGELICDANLANSKISQNSYLAISGLFCGERSIEVILTAKYVPTNGKKKNSIFFLPLIYLILSVFGPK